MKELLEKHTVFQFKFDILSNEIISPKYGNKNPIRLITSDEFTNLKMSRANVIPINEKESSTKFPSSSSIIVKP